MTSKIYSVNPKKTASLRGIPVPDSFYKDHPQWDNANVKIEVLSDNTLLVRLVSEDEDEQEEEDPEMLRLFLDALMARRDKRSVYSCALYRGDESESRCSFRRSYIN